MTYVRAFQEPADVETAATLDQAKRRVNELTKMFRDAYFIFDIEDGCFIVPRQNETGK